MSGPVLAGVNLNSPGGYYHWNVFVISEANFWLIVSMLAIFVLALLLPFPRERAAVSPTGAPVGGDVPPRPDPGARSTKPASWTGRVRAAGLRWLPPDRLLPEEQPSYVSSWIYVFGVATLAAFAVAVASGFLIALGGVDWWHTNPGGHFFNSLHLWSVELFMAFMVIHLWGKFFMAAWRGKRARTWVTGVLAFGVSIIEALTGYLSQSNFDSQWISTNGKDAFNAAGVGGFFNLMNGSQMLLWHVVLVPLVLVLLIGLHVLFVRYRGVVHPFPARRGRDASGRPLTGAAATPTRREAKAADGDVWRGPTRRYDIVREAVAATVVVVAVTVALAGVLSSPDVAPVSIRSWATSDPGDFVATAAAELAGTSETADYGPPYNDSTGFVQKIIVSWQSLAGVRERVDPAAQFVVDPLTTFSAGDPRLAAALGTYNAAGTAQQQKWATNYGNGLDKATVTNGSVILPAGDYGPVRTMLASELVMARAGGLDASLVAKHDFYGSDLTKPLLFLEDGAYYGAAAQDQHLLGNQWGVMNETGSYPGQPWLWLYQLWYHLPGFRSSANVDLIAIYLTGVATILLLLVPFIPLLRSAPRWVPFHRLIWRDYYREAERT